MARNRLETILYALRATSSPTTGAFQGTALRRPCLNCCRNQTVWRRRGLCQSCYHKCGKIYDRIGSNPKGGAPTIETRLTLESYFPNEDELTPEVLAILCPEAAPVESPPGTDEHIRQLQERAAKGLPLRLPGDAGRDCR